ncbi:hypothetical protein GCM10009840_32160 [Pseudolysinimonas kribbensis]|uniref:Uncharacterized protein n=1 Tax=Pseudolysinimonas kribbensis TaxID=433641 RepID=A0ABQ6K2M8_9MICO|nr:hypothetical protein GCM10025881_01340 [Pseudolysinimonas kribbensis]
MFAEQIDGYWALSDQLRGLMFAGHGPGGDAGLEDVLRAIAARATAAADAVAVIAQPRDS